MILILISLMLGNEHSADHIFNNCLLSFCLLVFAHFFMGFVLVYPLFLSLFWLIVLPKYILDVKPL